MQKEYNNGSTEVIHHPYPNDICMAAHEGVWYRAQVVDAGMPTGHMVKVHLLDIGKKVHVHPQSLCMMLVEHAHVPLYLRQCKVSVFASNRECQTPAMVEQCSEYFGNLCKHAHQQQIIVKTVHRSFCVVYLMLNKFTGHLKLRAFMLIDNYAVFHVGSLQQQYLKQKFGRQIALKKSDKIPTSDLASLTLVNVVHVTSTGEFYICPLSMKSRYRALHFAIQHRMQNITNSAVLWRFNDWSPGDRCFCYTKSQSDDPAELSMWYRASVVHVAIDWVTVRLWDIGCALNMTHNDLMPLQTEEDVTAFNVPERVVRCNLLGANEWQSQDTSLDFRNMCHGYTTFAVHSGAPINGSLPVVLYGIRFSYTFSGTRKIISDKLNINLVIMSKAVVRLINGIVDDLKGKTVSFGVSAVDDTVDDYDWDDATLSRLPQVQHPIDGGDDDLEHSHYYRMLGEEIYNFHLPLDSVDKWLPAVNNTQLISAVIPTNVDARGTINVHSQYNRYVTKRIQMAIEQRVHGNCELMLQWRPGQVCLAKFHADNRFYRGVVQRVDRQKFRCVVRQIVN